MFVIKRHLIDTTSLVLFYVAKYTLKQNIWTLQSRNSYQAGMKLKISNKSQIIKGGGRLKISWSEAE